MNTCRGCGGSALHRVLDLGAMPAADHFPPAEEAGAPAEATHPLAMDMCGDCALAQLAEDDTVTDEPRGVEPQALVDQAAEAVAKVADGGWLTGATVTEFGSPHGGSWLSLLAARGYRGATADIPADVVLDCFGIMHEPDQRAAFAARAAATAAGGLLLVQYHSLATIVRQEQWNALRHGHFAYYSLTALTRLLRTAGMSPVTAWEFDLYGGTVLVAARHGDHRPDAALRRVAALEEGAVDVAAVGTLHTAARRHAADLRGWLSAEREKGRQVYAYGAASRAVALFCLAGLDRTLIAGVADASPAKQGRRMPGTDIGICSPEQMVAAAPDRVLLTVADLLPEVSRAYPELRGCWVTDGLVSV